MSEETGCESVAPLTKYVELWPGPLDNLVSIAHRRRSNNELVHTIALRHDVFLLLADLGYIGDIKSLGETYAAIRSECLGGHDA